MLFRSTFTLWADHFSSQLLLITRGDIVIHRVRALLFLETGMTIRLKQEAVKLLSTVSDQPRAFNEGAQT